MIRKAFIFSLIMVLIPLVSSSSVHFNDQCDVFVPISKYIRQGNAENLSAWFAENLEINLLGNVNECSRNQACQIMKDFFNNNNPKQFNIMHKSGRAPMKYAIGLLEAGGNKYRVTIFVKTSTEGNYIQQIRIIKN